MSPLHLLPVRSARAAENMAVDFLLLQRYPEPGAPRFRHYGWHAPAFTFGFSQKIAFVRDQLAAELPIDLCRRPTGGGIVDHRNDWTYAVVVPRAHPLYDQPAPSSYRLIHDCLASALLALGQPAVVKPDCDPCEPDAEAAPGPAGVCFQRAERFDVIHPDTGTKIAGAAQKRNKHGLLFQGSIERSTVGAIDWDRFLAEFPASIARALQTAPAETPWPELAEHELAGLIEQYSAPEWLEYR